MRTDLIVLTLLLAAGRPALANDLADAVEWVQDNGGDETVPGLAPAADEAHRDDALALLNSRDVRPGDDLDRYRCEDAPIDGFGTMRTSGEQAWALRECQARRWKRNELPGFVTLGPPALPERRVRAWVERASAETDVPVKLLETIIRFVSGFRPGVVSERGHLGLMQLRPDVLAELGISHGDLLDPRENIRVGALYLRALTFEYGSLKLALAAYRDGPAPVEAAGRRIPSQRRYIWFVREVIKMYYGSIREFPDEIGAESIGFVWTWLE